MKKIYMIAGAFSGEDYLEDEPEILGVYSTREGARKGLKEIIKDYEPRDGEEADVIDEDPDRWECTNFDDDSHVIIKIVEMEIQEVK